MEKPGKVIAHPKKQGPQPEQSSINPCDNLDDFICLMDEDMDQALIEKMQKSGYGERFIKKPLDQLSRDEKVSLWNLIDRMGNKQYPHQEQNEFPGVPQANITLEQ